MTRLDYDIVMATRNRPDAVALSLPLILRQTRLPARIVIVDSSEDPEPIETLARKAADDVSCPVDYLRAEAGLTHQRNVGLRRCASAVVIFPDDDSLLYPDAAEEMMAVYEADTEGRIAGVCARPMDRPPPETEGDLGSHDAEQLTAPRSALRRVRQKIKEALGFTNPFLAVGWRLNGQQHAPEWLASRDTAPVPYMTGFRMSFRRAAIAGDGFDETLRKYGWFEDVDASFTAMRHGLVVVANRARIYHHRTAARRDDGHRMGLWAILNRGYVVMKHVRANPTVFPDPRREARRLDLYCRARAMAYRLLARDGYDRDRARGAADALRQLKALTDAPAADLAAVYRRLDRS